MCNKYTVFETSGAHGGWWQLRLFYRHMPAETIEMARSDIDMPVEDRRATQQQSGV